MRLIQEHLYFQTYLYVRVPITEEIVSAELAFPSYVISALKEEVSLLLILIKQLVLSLIS